LKPYLVASEFIDFHHPKVAAKARELAADNELETTRRCFEFVRDEIKHSRDCQAPVSTCRASEVLEHSTGYCYAKSHLLAALLRANGIPTGLCYQRLTFRDDKPPYCLHGLNAVYLPQHGWYRVDARGNKEGVNAQFYPPQEQLAFAILHPGEADLPEIWAEPLPLVTEVLLGAHNWKEVEQRLPDIELIAV